MENIYMTKINDKQINIAFTFTKQALAQDKETGFWVSSDGKEVYLDSNKDKGLKLYKTGKGYYQVSHNQDLFYVHRIVAGAFIPNLLDKPFINHIDGNKLNNDISNLEWVTASENTQHAYESGLMNKKQYECTNCHEKIGKSKTGLCARCKKLEKQKQSAQLKIESRRKQFKNVDLNDIKLDDTKALMLNMYLNTSKSLQEIGNDFGFSRQYVHHVVNDAINKGLKEG